MSFKGKESFFKPKRTGSRFAFVETDSAFEEKGFYSEGKDGIVNQRQLMIDLKNASSRSASEKIFLDDEIENDDKELILKNFYYKDYTTYDVKLDLPRYDPPFNPDRDATGVASEYIISYNFTESEFKFLLNKRMDLDVYAIPAYTVEIDISKMKKIFLIKFFYQDNVDKPENEEIFTGGDFDADTKKFTDVQNKVLAIEVRTNQYIDLVSFIKQFTPKFDVSDYCSFKFYEAYKKISNTNFQEIYDFYEMIPDGCFKYIPDEQLIKDLTFLLVMDMISFADDSSEVMLKILLNFNNHENLYDTLYKDPTFTKLMYSYINGANKMEQYCNFLTSLCLIYQSVESIEKLEVINYGKNYQLDSDVFFGESNSVRIKNDYVTFIDFSISTPYFEIETDIEVEHTRTEQIDKQFNPMDLVVYKDSVSGDEILVSAMYIKWLSDQEEWSNIISSVVLIVNIITIWTSVGIILKGAVGVIRFFAIADIIISSTDSLLQNDEFKGLLEQSGPAGAWLVKEWGAISMMSSMGIMSQSIASGFRTYGKQLIKNLKKQDFKILEFNTDELIDQIRNYNKLADDVLKNISKNAKKIWDDFNYEDLFNKTPPMKKPCFLEGTLVKTKNGLIPIEKIEQGIEVLSYNFENKKTEYKSVVQTFTNYAEKYLEIHTENDILKVTGAHLFYIPSDKKWIAASHLKIDMQLIDTEQNVVFVKKLKIIKKEVTTYNLEVTQNHNYYVGEHEHILTHNDGKKLKFTSEALYDFEFYEFLDFNNAPTYLGQTTQGITKRGDQHYQDFKKYPEKKEFIGVSRQGALEIAIDGKRGPFKMTPFEAAVTETYELNMRGGKRIDNKGLFNKKNPVAKATFDRIKGDFPNFNPCRFYV